MSACKKLKLLGGYAGQLDCQSERSVDSAIMGGISLPHYPSPSVELLSCLVLLTKIFEGVTSCLTHIFLDNYYVFSDVVSGV